MEKKESKKDEFFYINTCLSEKDTLFLMNPNLMQHTGKSLQRNFLITIKKMVLEGMLLC